MLAVNWQNLPRAVAASKVHPSGAAQYPVTSESTGIFKHYAKGNREYSCVVRQKNSDNTKPIPKVGGRGEAAQSGNAM